TWKTEKPGFNFEIKITSLTSPTLCISMRQLSEFLAPKNGCPENSAHKSRLADKHKTEKPREQRKTITN
ncbi:hypothetical protein ACM6XV_004317, partial [Vibrio vulnificus]